MSLHIGLAYPQDRAGAARRPPFAPVKWLTLQSKPPNRAFHSFPGSVCAIRDKLLKPCTNPGFPECYFAMR
ncbi:hypothetical protein SAMN06272759_10522 [Novosphingobium sp. B1]|nr:hypothetical protein SAMN06272759_10522 [Novosphingobium sp. B1]